MKDNTFGDYSKEEEYGQAPTEPHDEYGRPVKKRKMPKNWAKKIAAYNNNRGNQMKKFRDIIFYTVIGLLFGGFVLSIIIICLPYYLGKKLWEKFEDWQQLPY